MVEGQRWGGERERERREGILSRLSAEPDVGFELRTLRS